MSYDYCLKQLGYYRAINEAAKQFNSIVFRVIVGVLASVPLEIVAIVTSIEFILNSILEIAFGRVADRYGRIRTATWGFSFIAAGLTCCYIALSLPENDQASYILFLIHGILIGVAKPLISGSVDAFYQDSLAKLALTSAQKDSVKTSFTTSQTYGKYLTSIAVLASFGIIFLLHKTIGAQHSLIVGVTLWILVIQKVSKDHRIFGDKTLVNKTQTKVRVLMKSFISNRNVMISVLYNLSFYAFTVIIAGYFVISLGRQMSEKTDTIQFLIMGSFMMGYAALGWVVKSLLLPKLIIKLKPKSYISLWYIVLAISSVLAYSAFLTTENGGAMIITSLVFGSLFHVSVFAIHNVSLNMILAEFEPESYATILSIQNILGFIWVGIYSLMISSFYDGAPTVFEALASTTALAILFLFIHLGLSRVRLSK